MQTMKRENAPDSVKSWGGFARPSPKQPISHNYRRRNRLAGCLIPSLRGCCGVRSKCS